MRKFILHQRSIYRSFVIEKLSISRARSFLVASRKTHRPNVSASAVNLLRQKRKKRTLVETLWVQTICKAYQQTIKATTSKDSGNKHHFLLFLVSCFSPVIKYCLSSVSISVVLLHQKSIKQSIRQHIIKF